MIIRLMVIVIQRNLAFPPLNIGNGGTSPIGYMAITSHPFKYQPHSTNINGRIDKRWALNFFFLFCLTLLGDLFGHMAPAMAIKASMVPGQVAHLVRWEDGWR